MILDASHEIPIVKFDNFLSEERFNQLRHVNDHIVESHDPMFICPRGFNRKLTVDAQILKIIQFEKKKEAEDVFGCKLKPAFTILSMYHEGGNCYHHYDREMCKYMINISVFSNTKWDLKVNDNTINLNDNEAIFMSGTYHKHGRVGELKVGELVSNAFIYYVDEKYEGPLW